MSLNAVDGKFCDVLGGPHPLVECAGAYSQDEVANSLFSKGGPEGMSIQVTRFNYTYIDLVVATAMRTYTPIIKLFYLMILQPTETGKLSRLYVSEKQPA